MCRRTQTDSLSSLYPTAIRVPLLALGLVLAIHPCAASAEETVFTSLRAMQSTYSITGGDVILEWKVEGVKFTWVVISVDSKPPFGMWQTKPGITIEGVDPGFHQFTVEGISPRGRFLKTADLIVLTECPLQALPPFDYLYYGFEAQGGRGYLQVAWQAPERPSDDPWVDFEIILNNPVDGEFHWVTEDPDHAVTFSNIREGPINVAIIASTWSYLALPVAKNFYAIGLLPPQIVRFDVKCKDGQGVGTIHYKIPSETPFDRVAVWLTSDGKREYQGLFNSNPTAVQLTGLPERGVEVEIAGARVDVEGEVVIALSNLPDRTGPHAIASGWINCDGKAEFRRGDADADGRADITDAIRILNFLFQEATPLPCPSSGDVDGNGALEITDPVRLLTFLFGDGESIPDPGPLACGEDPAANALGDCTYDACAIASPGNP